VRIKRLSLKAFGHFTDRTLDFTSELPGLHVVYGPNEAGKSSSMRALQALFFGFPVRSGDNFLHAYDQLLVGGCLQGNDGSELTFSRRKKNRNSLFDEHDNPLDPALLAPFLHGLEQDLFNTLYGINHESLVRGGQGILDQKGEVGQALFSAGTGLASLKSIVDELEAEADNLFRPRGSSQAISVLLNRYKELQSHIKQATLSSRDWQEHQRALGDAVQKLERANALRAQLNREKRQLERLKQALPTIGQRRSLLEKLADLGDVVELPPDFSERRRSLEQQAVIARSRLESSKTRQELLEEKRRGVSLDQGLLDHAEAIEDMHQGLGQYRKAKADRPLLEGRRIGCRTDAAHLLKQIKPLLSLDEIEVLRPSLAKRKTIQALGARHEALVLSERTSGRLVQTTAQDLEAARCGLEKLSLSVNAGKLPRMVMSVQKVGDLDGEISAKRRNLNTATTECRSVVQRLGLWSGPLELLNQLAVPLPETVRRHEEELSSLSEKKRQLTADAGQLENDQILIDEQLHEIEYAAEVPSEDELLQFRSRRDLGWQLLRSQWLQGEDVTAKCIDYDSERPLPEAYERLVGISDQTADRLYREADRVQKHASLKAKAEVIAKRRTELNKQLENVYSAAAEADNRWQELWAPCSIKPLLPREMQAWLNCLDKLRFQVAESDKIAQDLQGQEDRRRELRTMLIAELVSLGERQEFPGEELSPVLLFAEALVQRVQKDLSRREIQAEKIRVLDKALESARSDHLVSETELRHWQSLWNDALLPLEIGNSVLPAEAIDFIETLQACFDKLKEADDFSKRRDGIDRDAREFEEALLVLKKNSAPDLAECEANQAVTQLKSRLGRASQDQTLVQQYTEEILALEVAISTSQAELDSFEVQLAVLRRIAVCETEEQIDEAERRSHEYLKLKNTLAETEVHLIRIAEGISLIDLEHQAGEVDPDDLPGRIEGLARHIDGVVDPEISQLSEIIGREKNELARMNGSGTAAELAEESQQALAKIRRLTDRYIRLKLSTKILREEIERYRAENQDPVLKIASGYFRELTLGSFVGLRTDSDEQGQPVLIGIRANGAWLHVGGMSTGTCDQLYLALRLATLEWRIQTSEPMPFIVDDILINFDDKRSKATLQALSNLAEKTQVILFTHHGQVFEDATSLACSGRVFVYRL